MKIGIVTFHKSYNYGSALQAYALQTYLSQKGYEVNIIDFILIRDFQQYNLFRTHLYKIHPKVFIRDVRRLFRNIKRKNCFDRFSKKYFMLSEKTYNEKSNLSELNQIYDCFICGSDQIWNLDCTGGVVPAFFLGFVEKDKKRIAYAPSIAHASFEGDVAEIKNYLDVFTAISVREESTIPFVERYTKNKVMCTVDPTLLLDPKEYLKIADIKDMETDYIFYYHLEDNEEMKKWCREFAKKRGLKIIYIYKDTIKEFKNAQNVYGCSPESFMGYIYKAKYVITNSFHATVFSILFKKQFVTFQTSNSAARMIDLLEYLELQDRLFGNRFKMEKKIDYRRVFANLQKYKEYSEIFIQQSLEEG
ncbi:hypothetical protein BHF69_09670 [Anaerostipes sp. 992a]|uniref:polysaccharide pyruvyl transferase family protein n=1 Tax=Anaerostipes sp. 992a TaxID=1261637 RepID=UPI0009534B0A|nr:polysaccharide pyruvyl transferase family protein [Anaerostipes sp. 992a]OLR62923.1 hypothetical protein BHF69_09670 [Anaerostipes sp. 992a]